MFDTLGLHPDAVKIDVEGRELDVLTGMKETLRVAGPALMIETNSTIGACQAFLTAFGYRFFIWDDAGKRFQEEKAATSRNWFALPPDRITDFAIS